MLQSTLFRLLGFVFIGLAFTTCKRDDDGTAPDTSINLFSVQKDIDLGMQLRDEIAANPTEYPVLDETQYPDAYGHLRRIRDEILNSGEVKYKDDFEWEVYIIQDDNVLNAFCAPGGYIYVYTGLIKYLTSEHELAGVMGHEIAHADRRHSTDQLTQQYGLSILLELALGENQGLLSDVAANLITLKYSRNAEVEADDFSVVYLCPTDYMADGAAGFFEKLEAQGQGGSTPAFLSTHPSPDSRIDNIKDKRTELNCTGTEVDGQYQDFINSLP
ncbi:MAG: M48 family metalloprotease [Salibacteraceae bacterium]